MSVLKPCPFCGSTEIDPEGIAYINPDSGVKTWNDPNVAEHILRRPACDNCGASTHEDWNTRTPSLGQRDKDVRIQELLEANNSLVLENRALRRLKGE